MSIQTRVNETIENLTSKKMIKSANFLNSIDLNPGERNKEDLSLFYITHQNILDVDYIRKYLLENYFHSSIQFQSTSNFYNYLSKILKERVLYSQDDIKMMDNIFYIGDLCDEPENDLRLAIFFYQKIFFEENFSITKFLSIVSKKLELEKEMEMASRKNPIRKNPIKIFFTKLSINKLSYFDRSYIINHIRRNLDF